MDKIPKGIIGLQQGMCAIVDLEDQPRVMARKWRVAVDGTTGRAIQVCSGERLSLAHFVLGVSPNRRILIDHKSGNIFDNRKNNLRLCTPSENNANSRKRNGTTSQYKGVSWYSPRKTWRAQTKKHGVGYHLGYYHDEKQAALAYNKAAVVLFGEFARLNEIAT